MEALERLRTAEHRAVGTNQTAKAIRRGRAQLVFVAADAELGPRCTPFRTTLATWSPVADRVEALVFDDSAATSPSRTVALRRGAYKPVFASEPTLVFARAFRRIDSIAIAAVLVTPLGAQTTLGVEAVSLKGGMAAYMDLLVERTIDAPASLDRLLQFDRIGKGSLAYALVSDRDALLVDPPRDAREMLAGVRAANARVIAAPEAAPQTASLPPAAPANDYGVTHWFAEEYVRMYGRTGGPDHVILRPTNIYGAPAHRDVDRWSQALAAALRIAADGIGRAFALGGERRTDRKSSIAAATAYSAHGVTMVPFYIFYSIFGFQRVADLIWGASDARARGFLIGATSGRTALSGEGLQHQDGSSHISAATFPNCVAYDPTYGYELAVIIQDGLRRMVGEQQNVFYYLTVMNENYAHPAMPKGTEAGILKGLYKLREGSAVKKGGSKSGGKGAKKAPRIQLMGSGTILREVLAAADLLERERALFKTRRDALLEVERDQALEAGEDLPFVVGERPVGVRDELGLGEVEEPRAGRVDVPLVVGGAVAGVDHEDVGTRHRRHDNQAEYPCDDCKIMDRIAQD